MGYPSIYVSATHGPSLETRGLPVDTDGPPMGHHINAWGIHALRMECPWDAHGLLTLLGLQTRFGDNWGKITWNLSGLSPKRDCSSKGAEGATGTTQAALYKGPPHGCNLVHLVYREINSRKPNNRKGSFRVAGN